MSTNLGKFDRVFRIFVAAALAVVGFVLAPQGLWWLALVAIVPLITAVVGFCPLYRVVGIKTIFVKKL